MPNVILDVTPVMEIDGWRPSFENLFISVNLIHLVSKQQKLKNPRMVIFLKKNV
jgi:hypothetical protein